MGRIILLLCFVLIPGGATAVEASVSASIPPQQHKLIRLKNLPAKTTLQVIINSTGKLIAALYHEEEINQQTENAVSVFNSKFDRRISFSLKIEKSGNYYLILKNQSNKNTVKANIAFAAEIDPAISKAKANLLKFEQELMKYIKFNSFPIKIIECRNSSLSIPARSTVLCAEHIKFSSQGLKHHDDISDYLFYILLHLSGHQILVQWGLNPVKEKEVNEFTVAMLYLLNRQKQTHEVLDKLRKYYAAQQTVNPDQLNKYHIPDVNQLTHVSNLIAHQSLSKEWQEIMIPRIRSHVLQKLVSQPDEWIDQKLIKKELAIRKTRTNSQYKSIDF